MTEETVRALHMWAQHDLLCAAYDGRPLPTDSIDVLTPWQAKLVVSVCARAGAVLEHGDVEELLAAAEAAHRTAPLAKGWWRAALGDGAAPAPQVQPPRARPRNRFRSGVIRRGGIRPN